MSLWGGSNAVKSMRQLNVSFYYAFNTRSTFNREFNFAFEGRGLRLLTMYELMQHYNL